MITEQELTTAAQIVYAQMAPTPQYAWPGLSEQFGCEVWVKHENHTPIGAFKVRGGLVYMHELSQREGQVEIVTATRGNHGQSIPYAARLHDMRVRVYVPEGNSEEKNTAMRGWGAELRVVGQDFDEARMAAEQDARESGAHLVPSFHRDLIRGVATYAQELFTHVTGLDRVYVPIGMGSGAASIVAVRDLLGLSTDVIGVVSTAADAMAQSIESGKIVQTESALTFADGVATRVPHEQAFEVLRKGLADVVRVSDDEIAAAMRMLYATTHNVAEGAGAAATAAAYQERARNAGKRVAVVLTGGNIDQPWLAQVLGGDTPQLQ